MIDALTMKKPCLKVKPDENSGTSTIGIKKTMKKTEGNYKPPGFHQRPSQVSTFPSAGVSSRTFRKTVMPTSSRSSTERLLTI